MKDKYLAIAGFANEQEFATPEKQAEEFLESYFLDQNEGYHPDAESALFTS